MYSYGYYGNYRYGSDLGWQISNFFSTYGVVLLLVGLPLLILTIVAWCRLFHKAGIPWGFYFIPVYGQYKTFAMAESTGLFAATIITSVISGIVTALIRDPSAALVVYGIVGVILLIINAVYCSRLANCFGKGGGFAAGLFFLQPIFLCILAFGPAHYFRSVPSRESWTCPWCGRVNRGGTSCGACGKYRE